LPINCSIHKKKESIDLYQARQTLKKLAEFHQ